MAVLQWKKIEGDPATEGGHEFGDMSLSTIAPLSPASASSIDRTDPTVDTFADLNRTATSEERRGLETLLRGSVQVRKCIHCRIGSVH